MASGLELIARIVQNRVAVSLLLVFAWAFALQTGWPHMERLRVSEGKETIGITAGGRQVIEYRFVESPHKPYVSKLFSPSGTQVLRDSPSDHQHHHALMFALAADKIDFWSEGNGTGVEKHRSITIAKVKEEKDASRAGFDQELEWRISPTGDALLFEHRTIEALAAQGLSATLLSWRSSLVVRPGKAQIMLTGEHYFGLGMRFVESMDRGGRFINSEGREGEVVRGSEKLTPARWCAYTAEADGRTVTVALFDHTVNPRHPANMFTMAPPFAYLAATLNLWKEPITLQTRQKLELLYGVAVWDGAAVTAQIDSTYKWWVDHALKSRTK